MPEPKFNLPVQDPIAPKPGVTPIADPIPPVTPPVQLTYLTIGEFKFKVNAEGNAVDEKGTIIKTKAELEALKAQPPVLTPEQKAIAEKKAAISSQLVEGAEVDIDNVTYKLNKDGAAVDATGKVVKTKAQLEELMLAEPPAEINYIEEIQKASNLIILDDKGKPIIYENTVPGLTQYANDVHKEGIKLGATEYEENLLQKYPLLPDILNHLDVYGSLKDFTEEVDYTKITIGENEAQHVEIFTKAKRAQGVPDSEIEDLIKYYKEDKKLKSAAEVGLNYLKGAQTKRTTERANQQAQAKAAEEKAQTEYWNEVTNIVNAKKIVIGNKQYTIPEVIHVKTADGKIVTKTVKDFLEYIQKPITVKINGKNYTTTQLQYDEHIASTTRTPHHDLFDAYRMFTKYDDSQLIAANVNSEIVKHVIKLKTKASNAGEQHKPGGTVKLNVPVK